MRASQQASIPLDISGILFEAIRGWVSHMALRKVQEQRQLLSKSLKASCTRSFTSSYGLPCVHTLKTLEQEGRALLLEHFHPHWHLKRDVSRPQPMLEPRTAPGQCKQRRSQPKSSTRREPSAFEAVEATSRPRAQPLCRMCHTLGHRMTSKACPLRFAELFQSPGSATEVGAQTTRIVAVATVARVATEATPVQAAVGQIEAGLRSTVQAMAGHTEADEIVAVQEAADHAPASQISTFQEAADCIVVNQTVVDQTVSAHRRAEQTMTAQATVAETVAAPELRYDDPRAIHQRYVEARKAWYRAQPRGSIKTNQQYRKATGLPQRYDKVSFTWCLDWKQMGRQCIVQGGSRDWTKEEMMAYLDWSKAEEDRVEAQVAAEMEDNRFSKRRGMREIWVAAAADCDAQEALHLGK